jgi:hypothetical protein
MARRTIRNYYGLYNESYYAKKLNHEWNDKMEEIVICPMGNMFKNLLL